MRNVLIALVLLVLHLTLRGFFAQPPKGSLPGPHENPSVVWGPPGPPGGLLIWQLTGI